MTLRETLVQAMFEHRGLSPDEQELLRPFVEDDVDAIVAATRTWLGANEPTTDAGYMSEDPEDWAYVDGFTNGTEAVINLLTSSHTDGKVGS